MRMLGLFICVISLFSCQRNEIDKKLLEQTWLPILQQNYKGDTSYFDTPASLLSFLENDHGVLEYSGTPISTPFTFSLSNDSLFIKYENVKIDTAIIRDLSQEEMKLFFDSTRVVSFIPIPKFNNRLSIQEIQTLIDDETWILKLLSPYEDELKLYLENILRDSSLVRYPYQDKVNTLFSYSGWSGYSKAMWSLGEHAGSQILRIQQIFSSYTPDYSLIFKSVENEQIELISWQAGEKYEYVLKRVKRCSDEEIQKQLENLTNQKWRFNREILPPPIDTTGLMDLGMAPDDFEELDDHLYMHDSTLILTQTDLDEKRLILEFNVAGNYTIYREARVLDKGSWELLFNSTLIKLTSSRVEMSDGLLGGFIEIESISGKEFKIKRVLESRLNRHISIDHSYVEIYEPIQ